MKKYNVLAAVLIFSMAGFQTQIAATPEAAKTVETRSGVAALEQAKKLKPQKIESLQMQLLNAAFEDFPICVVRMQFALKTIGQIEKNLGAFEAKRATLGDPAHQDDTFITQSMNSMVDPVKEFFDIIRNHKGWALPLIQASLDRTGRKAETSVLYKFFVTKDKLETFVFNEIKDLDALRLFCADLLVLIKDIRESLTPKAKAEAAKLIRELQNKKK